MWPHINPSQISQYSGDNAFSNKSYNDQNIRLSSYLYHISSISNLYSLKHFKVEERELLQSYKWYVVKTFPLSSGWF